MADKNIKTPKHEIPRMPMKGPYPPAGGRRRVRKKPRSQNIFFYILIALLGLGVFLSFSQTPPVGETKPISEILKKIDSSEVKKIIVEGDNVTAELLTGETIISLKEEGSSFYEILDQNKVDASKVTEGIEISQGFPWGEILLNIAPIALTALLFIYIFRQARGGAGDIFSFGRSRAKLFMKGKSPVTFKDVAGLKEARQEIMEIVDFLKNPKKYRAVGARIPRGVLLLGPSGVGKTLLARAVAGEANVPFFSVAGSEFMEMLVGVGSSRVRDLFGMAKASQPALIFIDEIDAIGRQRGMGIGGGHDEREQTLNQILVEMDGFDPRTSVIVMAASVTGDTPILVKDKYGKVNLKPIREVVDPYYEGFEEGEEKEAGGLQVLTSDGEGKNIRSRFSKVRGVFRHKVNGIYEIEYLGGKVRATGNHSVFVRKGDKIKALPVAELMEGDVLVDITPKEYERLGNRNKDFNLSLKVYSIDRDLLEKYEFVMANKGILSQERIAEQPGVWQTTVSLWHRGINVPRGLSRKYFKEVLPEEVPVTPELMRLFGYYTAKGYARKEVDFCFNEKEIKYVKDVKRLVKVIFGLDPYKERRQTNSAVNIIYQSKPLADLFKMHCGSGASNKHIPPFLFEAPYEYFIEYLDGLRREDGHINKGGKLEITSVSKRLITELNWLCRSHGIKSYINSFMSKGGRIISGGKPLSSVKAYRLGMGKYYNPFNNLNKSEIKRNPKSPIVKSVMRLSFNDYVYDICGSENEAFFGGDSPILLHNSNRPDMLDPALIRPGRFDRRVILDLPDIVEREAIIKIHMRGKPFTKGVNIKGLARRTVGYSGADIENMLNESAILAARDNRKAINGEDLEEAATKVKLGPERKKLQSDEEKKMVAYHEAGHALVAVNLPNMDPVHRISIVARGLSLGHTMFPPKIDRYNETKTRLLEMITTALGGRAAEEIVFNEMTIGAASDIERATQVARSMVTEFGMSELGPVSYQGRENRFFLARQLGDTSQVGEETATKIDEEVKKIVDESFSRAKKILSENRDKLNIVAKELIKRETIEGEEFEMMIGKVGKSKERKVNSKDRD